MCCQLFILKVNKVKVKFLPSISWIIVSVIFLADDLVTIQIFHKSAVIYTAYSKRNIAIKIRPNIKINGDKWKDTYKDKNRDKDWDNDLK